MLQDEREAFHQLFSSIYRGHQEAEGLSFKLLDMAHALDDLIDRDKEISNADIYKLFSGALFQLPATPLYNNCGIYHHLLNTYLRWRDANTIEADNNRTEDDLTKTYMLRAGIYDIFVVIAYYLYGEDWAAKVGPIVRRFYGETLGEYISEIGYAKSSSGNDSGVGGVVGGVIRGESKPSKSRSRRSKHPSTGR